MSELRALIHACKDEPDDDAPRLILADWLDEHGEDERAAFIRRQLSGPRVFSFLLADDSPPNPQWLGGWHRGRSSRWEVRAHRGFFRISESFAGRSYRIDRILKPPFDWTWVDGFEFHSLYHRDWTPLFTSPLVRELNQLEFTDYFDRNDFIPSIVQPLAECPHLTNLRHLSLHMVRDPKTRFEQISQAGHLNRLTYLALWRCGVGQRAALAFAKSEVWDNLESCTFSENRFDDTALTRFAKGRVRPKLTSLDISCGRYTDDGLVELSRSTCFPNLKRLRIGYSSLRPVQFGPVGIESLLGASFNRPYRLVVSIRSRDPIPDGITELCQRHADRVVLEHRQLKSG